MLNTHYSWSTESAPHTILSLHAYMRLTPYQSWATYTLLMSHWPCFTYTVTHAISNLGTTSSLLVWQIATFHADHRPHITHSSLTIHDLPHRIPLAFPSLLMHNPLSSIPSIGNIQHTHDWLFGLCSQNAPYYSYLMNTQPHSDFILAGNTQPTHSLLSMGKIQPTDSDTSRRQQRA